MSVTFFRCGEAGCQTLLPSDYDGPRLYGVPIMCDFHRRRYEARLRLELDAAVRRIVML